MATDDPKAPQGRPGDPSSKSKWLLLIPTEFERDLIKDSIPPIHNTAMEICGFGPIVPAARTMQLIERHHPDQVLLMGIAGSYDPRLEIGRAYPFTEVGCFGVGVGQAETFQTAQQMGWYHWLDSHPGKSIGDTIRLSITVPAIDELQVGLSADDPKGLLCTLLGLDEFVRGKPQLLTVCSAATSQQDVELRRKRFPNSVAEDMEGFAVAAACWLCEVPIYIVRGISNEAGDRNKQNWKIREALTAAIELSNIIIGSVH